MNFVLIMYLADVSVSISIVAALASLLLIALYLCTRWYAVIECEQWRPPIRMIYFAIGAAALASILPSKKTMYAWAAVSAGESAVTTKTGQKAVAALNAWLDKQAKQPESSK